MQQTTKSIYERHSGRLSHTAFVDKAEHLSATRDPFKPRQSDSFLAILTPAAIYAYNWKRANLSLQALHNFSWLYMVTWVGFAVFSVPWVLRVGNDVFERPLGDIESIFKVWPWYRYLRYAFVVPYLLQVVLALKAWWVARSVSKIAAQRCLNPERPVGTDFDIDVNLFGVHDSYPGTLLDDLFTMRLRADQLDVDAVMKPPNVEDVGGDEVLEDELFTCMPALMAAWYGPHRSLNLFLAALNPALYLFLSALFGMLLGWPVEFVLQWCQSSQRPAPASVTEVYRKSFMDAAWLLLYSGGISFLFMGLMILCYNLGKRTGVLPQLRR